MRKLALILLATGIFACNMTHFTAKTTDTVLQAAQPAFNQESDLQLAREAAPGQLKTVEGFLLASGGTDKIYIALLAEGYCSYTFGFVEDDWERLTLEHKDKLADPIADRAADLYLRCMNYGLKLLDPSWEKALYGPFDGWAKKVKSASADEIPGLFWTAFGLGSALNVSRGDIAMQAFLPKARVAFEQVAKMDPGFYQGGADMALGLLNTALSKDLGGDPEAGKKHFERSIELTHGKFLLPMVLEAMAYGQAVNDEKFFHDTLVKVLETSPAIWPDQRLANEIAHEKAERYLAHEKELF
jgi:hypothetical protein